MKKFIQLTSKETWGEKTELFPAENLIYFRWDLIPGYIIMNFKFDSEIRSVNFEFDDEFDYDHVKFSCFLCGDQENMFYFYSDNTK